MAAQTDWREILTRRQSDQNALAVVNFVLDDLCRPSGEGFIAQLEFLVLILYFDRFPPFCVPHSGERLMISGLNITTQVPPLSKAMILLLTPIILAAIPTQVSL